MDQVGESLLLQVHLSLHISLAEHDMIISYASIMDQLRQDSYDIYHDQILSTTEKLTKLVVYIYLILLVI